MTTNRPGRADGAVAGWSVSDEPLRNQVLGQLAAGWSPEQVAGRSGRIGAESIYRFVYAQITRHKDYRWRHYLPRGMFSRRDNRH